MSTMVGPMAMPLPNYFGLSILGTKPREKTGGPAPKKCNHQRGLVIVREIHGDERRYRGWVTQECYCTRCGMEDIYV